MIYANAGYFKDSSKQNPKWRFMSLKATTSNDMFLCVYAPSGHNTREQLARGNFVDGQQNYKVNKSEGIKNKIILREFNCTMDKMVNDGGNKTQRLYRCGSNYALLKNIVDNELENLWRRGNPDSSDFIHYDRPSGTRSRINRIYTDIQIVNNTKVNHIMESFADHYNAISLDRHSSKTKIGKD